MRIMNSHDTRSSTLNPNVGGPTQRDADAMLEALWRSRVAANEQRRARAERERPESMFLREQAI